MKRYSRLAVSEERRNIKKAYFYIFLSIASIAFLVLFGLPTLIKFAGFVGDVAKSDKPVEINDTTPPAPPQFDDIPDYTNKETLNLTGKSENGATVSIRANNENSDVVANSEGVFNFIFNLNDGENTIDSIATDLSGNKSTQTLTYTIVYDNKEPQLKIDMPLDNATFYGNNQRQLSIKGSVNEKVNLTINEKFVSLKDDNSFSFATTLNEGENKFEIRAVDPAGNETSASLTVTFTP